MIKYIVPEGSTVFAVPKNITDHNNLKPLFTSNTPRLMGKRKTTIRPYIFWETKRTDIPKIVSVMLGTWYFIRFSDEIICDDTAEWIGFLVSGTNLYAVDEQAAP